MVLARSNWPELCSWSCVVLDWSLLSAMRQVARGRLSAQPTPAGGRLSLRGQRTLDAMSRSTWSIDGRGVVSRRTAHAHPESEVLHW